MDRTPLLPPVTLDSFGEAELADLDDRTAHILLMRSGMWGAKRHTFSEVGEELGIHPSRVHRLQEDGLKVIRQLRESQRHLKKEPVSIRYRWTLPESVEMRRVRKKYLEGSP